MNIPAPIPLALCGTLVLAACSGGGVHGWVPASVPQFYESEPNDMAPHADFLGHVAPGANLAVHGEFDLFSTDPRDGFALLVDQPCEIQFILSHDFTGDFDMRVYDPFLEDYVAYFETDFNPEVGWITVHDPNVEVHLVVLPWSGFGDYTVDIHVYPYPGYPALLAATAQREGEQRSSVEAREPKAPLRAFEGDGHEAYFTDAKAQASDPWPTFSGTLMVLDPRTGQGQMIPVMLFEDGRVQLPR